MRRLAGNIATASALATLGLAVSATVHADTMSFQDGANGYQGTEDGHFYSSTLANRNSGASGSLQLGVTSNGTSERRAVIRFDVSSLAGEYGSIQSAQLKLTGTGAEAIPPPNLAPTTFIRSPTPTPHGWRATITSPTRIPANPPGTGEQDRLAGLAAVV